MDLCDHQTQVRRPGRSADADDPAAHVPGHLDRQLHDMEQVHGKGRARQHAAHR
jgi:hypothetical protein